MEGVRHCLRYQALAQTGDHDYKAMLTAKLQLVRVPLPPTWPLLPGVEARAEVLCHDRALWLGLPQPMQQLLHDQLGQDGLTQAEAMDHPAPSCIRVNTLRTTCAKLRVDLAMMNIDTGLHPELPHLLVLKGRHKLRNHPLYMQGHFEFQDGNSQRIAPLLEVQPGHSVWDACAGAGGKTLHLAALMHNKGHLLSTDISKIKLSTLTLRAHRAGVRISETRRVPADPMHLTGLPQFDRVLIDAPCTSIGTLRRKPDLKYRLSPANLAETTQLQARILKQYAMFVKPGGKLVYATCSILPDENERQIERFLQINPAFALEVQQTHLPTESAFDGFFGARLVRG